MADLMERFGATGWTVHQCPACCSWQIDYDTQAGASLSTFGMVDGHLTVDTSHFHAALEEEICAHLAECPDWWNGAEPEVSRN